MSFPPRRGSRSQVHRHREQEDWIPAVAGMTKWISRLGSDFKILTPSYDSTSGVARFPYALGDLRFTEVLTFPPSGDTNAAASDAFGKLLDLTAVTLGVSYYKLLAPLRIEVAFPLTDLGRVFALDVFSNGLGEFY